MYHFHRRAILGLALVLTAAGTALAGGFYLGLQQPNAVSDPRLKGAALLVNAGGCIRGASTSLSVTAEGLVNGRRRSIPVPATRVSSGPNHDLYAVKLKWPSEGAWLLVIHGAARHAGGGQIHQYRLLAWEPAVWAKNAPVDLPAKTLTKRPSPQEIDRMVRALDGKKTASARGGRSTR